MYKNSVFNGRNLSETSTKLPPKHSKHAVRGQQNRYFYYTECYISQRSWKSYGNEEEWLYCVIVESKIMGQTVLA